MSAVLASGLAVSFAVACALGCRLRTVSRLVGDAVHEVRGPVAAATLALDAGRRRGAIAPERADGLDVQLRRAARALEDLAAAPRRSRGPDRLRPVAADRVLAELDDAWSPVAEATGRTLSVAGSSRALLLADPVRLAQAAGNLVANALEHGDGPVELRLRDFAGRVRLEVGDAGPGLSAPIAALASSSGVRGRGLRIAAATAERHGGRLVTPPSSTGARLAIELPAYDSLDDVAR